LRLSGRLRELRLSGRLRNLGLSYDWLEVRRGEERLGILACHEGAERPAADHGVEADGLSALQLQALVGGELALENRFGAPE
jgi:hypothetical protein